MIILNQEYQYNQQHRFAHGEDTGSFGIDVEQDGITEAARLSQTNQVLAGTRLQMTIKGQSYLEVGDVVAV